MAVTLLENGIKATALRANSAYTFDVRVDGRSTVPEHWSVYVGASLVFSGLGTPVAFTPTQIQLHTVHVTVAHPDGYLVEGAFVLTVSAKRTGSAAVTVQWGKPFYGAGEDLFGAVACVDPEGLPAAYHNWTLRWNNKIVATGSGNVIRYQSGYHGLWRAEVYGADFYGTPIYGEATVFVCPSYERRDSVPAAASVDGTLIYIGAVFSNEVKSEEGYATSLPYQVATSNQSARLLPGTTHITFDIDPGYSQVDDEVVIRSHTGNYTLFGLLNGLDVGYDCSPVGYVPAPADQALGYTIDVFNTSGYAFSRSSFRVRIKCYRLSTPLYRYTPCPYSFMPGGEGVRNRRWGLVFTGIEAESSGKRLAYTTQEAYSIPLMNMTSTGLPNPYDALTKSFYTESNRFAIYECPDFPDLDAKAVCAVEGLRPFCMAMQHPAMQPEFKTLIRLKGDMVVYMNGAALSAGSTVRVRIQTGKGESVFSVPITSDVYNATEDTFVLVGRISIDLQDWQFDFNGVVAWVELDESTAVQAAPLVLPTPVEGPSEVYSGTYSGAIAQAVSFDGACYGGPVLADTVDAENASVVKQVSGCADPVCGPTGAYCYESICAPAECVCVTQPLHNPAPYVAYGTLPMRGYANPKFAYEGTTATSFVNVDLALCGDGYLYNRCDMSAQAVIVYPCLTAPHPFVYYAENCYQVDQAVTSFGTVTEILPVASVTPVSSCVDYICTKANAAGDSYQYFDAQTGEKVAVHFEHLSSGVPVFGVCPSKIDVGSTLTGGNIVLNFAQQPILTIVRARSSGLLLVDVGLANMSKRIVVRNTCSLRSYDLPIGKTSVSIPVSLGDTLSLDVSKHGTYTKSMRKITTLVRWAPQVDVPRLYDAAYGSVSGTYAVNAVGFTGPVDRAPYQFYASLPADVQSSNVNPDSLVTVKGIDVITPEYALIRCRAVGEVAPVMPSMEWYAGQTFTGRVQFSFYALRSQQASHGEMDVWFSQPGDFPDYLLAQPYRALHKDSRSYRRDSAATDANRNVFAASASINAAALPNVYSSATDGQVLSSKASSVSIVRGGKTLTKQRVDAGIAKNSVANDDVQITWVHVSDYGFNYPQRTDISNLVHSLNPDFIVSAGDNWQSGVTNALSSLDIKTGAYYQDFIYPYLGAYGAGAIEQRFFAGAGNHDHTPPGGGPINPASYRLPMFKQYFNLSDVNYEVVKWPVHFFIIDDTDYAIGDLTETGPTAQWLKAKLQASTAPWKVVVLHYPPWNSGIGHVPYTGLRWPYRSWGADVLVSGHVHVYERFMFPDGLMALTCGTCNPAYWSQMNPVNIWLGAPLAYSTYGYGIAPQQPATARFRATAHAFTLDYINTSSVILDTVTLAK